MEGQLNKPRRYLDLGFCVRFSTLHVICKSTSETREDSDQNMYSSSRRMGGSQRKKYIKIRCRQKKKVQRDYFIIIFILTHSHCKYQTVLCII